MTKTKNIQLGDKLTLPINEFKLSNMCKNPSIIMIAKRGSGKSWVCRDILRQFSDIPVGLVISPTERLANPPFYAEFVPDTYIHYDYSSSIIEKLLFRQDKMIEKKIEGKNVDPRSFILMDDCLSKKHAWMRDEPILELLFNGRHYEIMYLLTSQNALGITPELRNNFDYIFLLNQDFIKEQKKIHDHYAGMFDTFESFRHVFKCLTDDFGCMVIVNRGSKASFLDKIFWYKAKNQSIGMIGCQQYIDYHENNYDKSWKKNNKIFNAIDIMDGANKKNNKKFNVDKIKDDFSI